MRREAVVLVNDWTSTVRPGGHLRMRGFAGGFAKLGYDVYITTPWGTVSPFDEVDQPHPTGPATYLTFQLPLILQLTRTIARAGPPHLVYFQLPSPVTNGLLAIPFLMGLGAPVVVDFADPWWKPGDPELYMKTAATFAGKEAQMASLVTSDSRILLRFFSNFTRNALFLPSGVDTALFYPSPQDGSSGSKRVRIGATGSFIKAKGSWLLIPTLRMLVERGYDCELLLVGGGEDLSSILSEAVAAGLPGRVRSTGNVSRMRLARELSCCDVFIVPYDPQTSSAFFFPTKVPEMMALRRPVVATRLYELEKTFRGGAELLLAERDPSDYAEKIAWLIDNPGEAQAIAENGFRRVTSEFRWDTLARQMLHAVGSPADHNTG